MQKDAPQKVVLKNLRILYKIAPLKARNLTEQKLVQQELKAYYCTITFKQNLFPSFFIHL